MIQTLFGRLDENQQPSFLDRMKEAVPRTRENLTDRIEEVVAFSKEIDRATLDDLEATLIGKRGAVDLFAKSDHFLDAISEVLTGASNRFLHAIEKAWLLFFVETAKQSLNHEN